MCPPAPGTALRAQPFPLTGEHLGAGQPLGVPCVKGVGVLQRGCWQCGCAHSETPQTPLLLLPWRLWPVSWWVWGSERPWTWVCSPAASAGACCPSAWLGHPLDACFGLLPSRVLFITRACRAPAKWKDGPLLREKSLFLSVVSGFLSGPGERRPSAQPRASTQSLVSALLPGAAGDSWWQEKTWGGLALGCKDPSVLGGRRAACEPRRHAGRSSSPSTFSQSSLLSVLGRIAARAQPLPALSLLRRHGLQGAWPSDHAVLLLLVPFRPLCTQRVLAPCLSLLQTNRVDPGPPASLCVL